MGVSSVITITKNRYGSISYSSPHQGPCNAEPKSRAGSSLNQTVAEGSALRPAMGVTTTHSRQRDPIVSSRLPSEHSSMEASMQAAAARHDQDNQYAVAVDVGKTPTLPHERAVFVPLYTSPWQRAYAAFHAAAMICSTALCLWFWGYVVHYGTDSQPGAPWTIFSVLVTLFFTHDALNACCFALAGTNPQRVAPRLPAPRMRVAMIATKVPSEPLSVLKKTLGACLAQDYSHPYDVWLADERPDEETKAWCAEKGIRISCRFGVAEYHREEWPRRTRCKEGNLAYFYDHWGYSNYDVVCQFDADHVPDPDYLSKVLPAFVDPAIGYVALPSICGANETESWAVRSRLWWEALMHGFSGQSCNKTWLPMCIGSHYAVRTKHLQAAGGIGPELDEDMSTSIIMTSHGFKGAFQMDAIAHGDGPANFEDCMYQEYQWARSAMVLLVVYFRQPFMRLNWKEKVRVWFGLGYWINGSLTCLLPAVCLLLIGVWGQNVYAASSMAPETFVIHALLPMLLGMVYWCFVKAHGWLRPHNAHFVSLEQVLYGLTKPFWILQGTIHGLLGGLFGINFKIRVTPKGPSGIRPFPTSCLLPVLAYPVLASLVALLPRTPDSMLLLLALATLPLLACAYALVVWHYVDMRGLLRQVGFSKLPWRAMLSAALALLAATSVVGVFLYQKGALLLDELELYQAYASHNLGVLLRQPALDVDVHKLQYSFMQPGSWHFAYTQCILYTDLLLFTVLLWALPMAYASCRWAAAPTTRVHA